MTIGTNHPAQGAFSLIRTETLPPAESPLGARVENGSTTFSVFSKNATRVLLEIYDAAMGTPARFDYWMERGPGHVWHARVVGAPHGTFYAFRCWGPNWPFSPQWQRGGSAAGFVVDVHAYGHRFNPNKLLFDPYARELSHDRETPAMTDLHGHNGGMYGSGPDPYRGHQDRHSPVVRREFDTGPWAPKAIVIDDRTPTGSKVPRRSPASPRR